MKKAVILFIAVLFISIFSSAQIIENLDYISPFSDEVAAINKDGQWAFVNTQGNIVVNFRNDLVSTQTKDGNYPVFTSGRCIIVEENNGISYFGYIDKTGNTVIRPQFLNASNFINDKAIVLQVIKQEAGKNEIFNKNIVYYKYFEVIIDIDGNIKDYINPKGTHVALDEKFLKKPPFITSKLISKNLVAIKTLNKKEDLIKID